MAKLNKKSLLKLENMYSEVKLLKMYVDEKEYVVEIDSKFKQTKINSLIKELMISQELISKGSSYDVNTEVFTIMLILKTFTSLPYEKFEAVCDASINDVIATTNALKNVICDNGRSMFDIIMSELGNNEKELNKISSSIENVTSLILKSIKDSDNGKNV